MRVNLFPSPCQPEDNLISEYNFFYLKAIPKIMICSMTYARTILHMVTKNQGWAVTVARAAGSIVAVAATGGISNMDCTSVSS